ncbi:MULTISPECIES: DUF4251 domain-containing protein [Culturomica]|jgi:hypothetical protein|uniref:DUF4251 domain-containing protein n=1 Tax=Culturomica TaxID=1926651 RepID=UPI0003413976|nr:MULTISPECIES: DUF4251 domain-containing protein [Odoribacteraceae]RHV94717.1 DUF4251 domain-containing protein [Odoribacter sp. OF09-27XD]CCZ08499.1 putative uncharacterized protein [Odoribacter sp. CAG:788]HBO28108.1 DUF4251 domain-containing protein [Culturomica sp.]
MKKVIILLLMGLFLFPAMELLAQQQVQSQTQIQELTKKQIRKMKRDQRRHARQVANMDAFNAAVGAIKDNNWVLMANTLYGRRGNAIPVSDNTNFIQFKDNTVYVQLAFNGIAGPNGLGGITVQGSPSQIKSSTDKYGNITYSFYVNGTALTAQIVINLSYGDNYAQATVYPMMNNNNLTFSGILVPTSQSSIFRSGFISY